MKKMYEGKIPFSLERRAQLAYDNGRVGAWFDNIIFIATLKITTFGRGRSSAVFYGTLSEVDWLESDEYRNLLEGCEVSIFMSDMLSIMQHQNIIQEKVHSAKFNFCKRGSNYGLQLIWE